MLRHDSFACLAAFGSWGRNYWKIHGFIPVKIVIHNPKVGRSLSLRNLQLCSARMKQVVVHVDCP